jgi:TP901 family phage tail tape measure protein
MAVNLNVISQFDGKGLSRAQKELDKLAASTTSTSQKMMKGATIAGAAVLAGGVAVAAGLFQIGSTFDEAFDNIRIGTGATGEAFEGLKNDMKAIAGAVPASFKDAGTAVSEFNTRLGLTGAPLQTLSSQVLELSRMTKTDLGGNIKAVSSVFQNFGVGVDDQAGKLDLLFRASQASGVSVSELAGTMSGAGVVLRQVGFSFDQSAGLIATLAKAGVEAGDVMPALSRSLATAAKEGKDASSVFTDTFNAIKGAPDDVAASGIALEVFGAKAGPKLAAMIREGKLSFEEMTAAISSGGETILGASADTQSFAEKLTLLKNRVFLAIEPIATRVFNKIGELMDTLGPKFEQLTKFMTENGDTMKIVAGIIGGVMLVVLAAYTVSMIAAAAATIAAAAPFILIAALIAALVAGVIYAYKNFETFRKVVNAAWQGIQKAISFAWNNVIKPIWDLILFYIQNILIPYVTLLFNVYKKAFEIIMAVISFAWNSVIKPVWDKIYWYIQNILIPYVTLLFNVYKKAFEIIMAVVRFAWNNVIKPIWDKIYWYIQNILIPYLQILWNVVQAVWNAISGAINTAWNIIKGAFFNIISGIATVWGFFQTAKNIIGSVFSNIADAISGPFRTAFNFISDAWNNTIGKLSWSVPGWVPVIGGNTISAPKLPRFADGGIFNAGMGGGSGLAILHDNEMILNPQQQKALFSGKGLGGGPAINVTINTVAGDPDAIERIVIDAIARASRRGATVLVP